MNRLHLIYFSPTRTTRKIVTEIAAGIGGEQVVEYDLTLAPEPLELSLDEGVAILGVPVYAGRVPEVVLQRIERLSSTGRPAVLVALYGNREFEDALLELRDLALAKGFSVVAAGAFIGEHSYSTAEQPIAANRPDSLDLEQARAFGAAIAAKLRQQETPATPPIPGDSPYRDRVPLGGVAPETRVDRCTLCGTCAAVCPTLVIRVATEVETDAAGCIMCCACVKRCPEEARKMSHPRVQERRDLLVANCSRRKEPVTFL